MSARRVCRGTRPQRSHSRRLISDPPSRPDTWSAMLRATRNASSSGWRISWMVTRMRLPVIASSVRRSSSTLTPLLPMTMPGLAAWMVTVIMLAERSISTLATPASAMRVMMCWRTLMSSSSRVEYSRPVANQRPSQSLTERSPTLTPRRKPVGCTFCPIALSGPLLGNDHGDVARALQDLVDAAAGAGSPALQGAALVGRAGGDDQIVRVHVEVVLRVGHGRLDRLGHRERGAL